MKSNARTTRRQFLRASACGAAASAALPLVSAVGQDQTSAAKPNIVIILSDDHGIEQVGCYGAKVVRTPNIDRIAAEGLRFTSAFTATAMCAPSRSMMFTGLFPHRNGAHPNHSKVRPGIRSLPHYLKPLGYRVGLAGKRHVGPAEAFPFEYLTFKEIDRFLGGHGPCCLVIATHEPHKPWKRGTYDPAKVELPPYLVDTPGTRQEMADYYNDITTLDTKVGEWTVMLKRRGLADNTVLIYTSDHGAQFPHGKWTNYDAGLHVPFVVRWPGKVKPASATDAMISFVDVLPTLMEIAGGQAPADIDGRSFLPVLLGKQPDHREMIYGCHTNLGIIACKEPYPIRSIRTRTHKYIRNLNPTGRFTNLITEGGHATSPAYWLEWKELAKRDKFAAERVRWYEHRPAEELYDLRTDPHELHNIAADPANGELLKTLSRKLDEWIAEQEKARK